MSDAPPPLQYLADLVRTGRIEEFVAAAHDLEPADLADVLSALDETERLVAVSALPPELSGEALAEMPEEAHAEDTLASPTYTPFLEPRSRTCTPCSSAESTQ